MGAAVCDRVMALAEIISAVSRDETDFLVLRDLAEQVGQGRRISVVTTGDLDGPNLMFFHVESDINLSPDARYAGPPFLRACHSSAPLSSMPVLSASRQGITN